MKLRRLSNDTVRVIKLSKILITCALQFLLFVVFKAVEVANNRSSRSSSRVEKLDLVYNPSLVRDRRRMVTLAREGVREIFRRMDLEASYTALFEILWYSQLPCFDVKGVTSKTQDEYGKEYWSDRLNRV